MALTVAAAQLGAPWLELHPDLTARVLAQFPKLASADARAVCAAACVCKEWARAAAAPEVWRHIRVAAPLRKRGAPAGKTFGTPLTDARLANLVARAGGDLRSLDVTGCVELTDAGIVAALSQVTSLRRVLLRRTPPPDRLYIEPPKMTFAFEEGEFDAYQEEYQEFSDLPLRPKPLPGPKTKLSVFGIVTALHASAPLEELQVDGMQCPSPVGSGDDVANATLAALMPLVGGDPERLDLVLCGSAGDYWAPEVTYADDEYGWVRIATSLRRRCAAGRALPPAADAQGGRAREDLPGMWRDMLRARLVERGHLEMQLLSAEVQRLP